jgi:hypothetical protein
MLWEVLSFNVGCGTTRLWGVWCAWGTSSVACIISVGFECREFSLAGSETVSAGHVPCK